MELADCLHVDFKNQLINERQKYFHTKPADLQYEEDTFADKDYDKAFKLALDELSFLFSIMNDKSKSSSDYNLAEYCNNSVLSLIFKGIRYFSMLREQDLIKITKYRAIMSETYNFLVEKKEMIMKMYGVRAGIELEFTNTWRENEAAKIEQVKNARRIFRIFSLNV